MQNSILPLKSTYSWFFMGWSVSFHIDNLVWVITFDNLESHEFTNKNCVIYQNSCNQLTVCWKILFRNNRERTYRKQIHTLQRLLKCVDKIYEIFLWNTKFYLLHFPYITNNNLHNTYVRVRVVRLTFLNILCFFGSNYCCWEFMMCELV